MLTHVITLCASVTEAVTMLSSSQADRIEESIGVALCLSTMAAAGMGNMVSDLAGMVEWGMCLCFDCIPPLVGLGLADQVDSLCRALGIPNPKLSAGQLTHRASRWMALLVSQSLQYCSHALSSIPTT